MASRLSSNSLMIRPSVSPREAKLLAENLFGITVKDIKELASYDDRNFLVEVLACPQPIQDVLNDNHEANKFVFKLMHTRDTYSSDFLNAIGNAMQHFNAVLGSKYACPLPLPSLSASLNILTDIKIPEESEEIGKVQMSLRDNLKENGLLS